MNVAPATNFDSVIETGLTGLVGDITWKLTDADNGTVIPSSSDDIVENPAGSGVYVASRISPAVLDQYIILWSTDGSYDPDTVTIDELIVTYSSPTLTGSSGPLYITAEELKELRGTEAETFEDAAVDIAVNAASRVIDGYKQTRYYTVDEERIYTPTLGEDTLTIDDLATLTAVTVDADGDGDYETTWELGTDFWLDPANATLDGKPWERLVIRPQSGRVFPPYMRSVKVEGEFGWETIPSQVKAAAVLIANRFLARQGQAPLGILVQATSEAVAMARLGRVDPDVALLLDELPSRRRSLVSTKLG